MSKIQWNSQEFSRKKYKKIIAKETSGYRSLKRTKEIIWYKIQHKRFWKTFTVFGFDKLNLLVSRYYFTARLTTSGASVELYRKSYVQKG